MIRSNIDNYEEINCHASATFTVQQGKGMDTLYQRIFEHIHSITYGNGNLKQYVKTLYLI